MKTEWGKLGRNDTITPPVIATGFQCLIPHAKLYWIDECGHVPMLERPEKFNKILGGFLQSHDKAMERKFIAEVENDH